MCPKSGFAKIECTKKRCAKFEVERKLSELTYKHNASIADECKFVHINLLNLELRGQLNTEELNSELLPREKDTLTFRPQLGSGCLHTAKVFNTP